jgi:hypothetical protein
MTSIAYHVKRTAIAVCAILTLSADAVWADTAIDGTWSGGGIVAFASGGRERARCRVSYSSTSATTVQATGTCATDSGRVSQSAVLRRVSPGVYVGNFFNPEYSVSGRIRVTVRGNSQSATLLSQSGSASLSLRR